MQRLREKGVSLRKIAEALEREGVASKRGGKWTAQAVKLTLERNAA